MQSDNFDPSDPLKFIQEELDRCNHTELYQMCRAKSLNVHPSMSIDNLIDVFINAKPSSEPNVFDSWRSGLTGFVFEYWKILEPQLTCPIRSKDPTSCWGCLDTQVIACVEGTSQYEDAIRLHRK